MAKNKQKKNTELQNENRLEKMNTALQEVQDSQKYKIDEYKQKKKKIETVPKTGKFKKYIFKKNSH